MEQLKIFNGIADHCTTFDEFSYVWEVAQRILSDISYELFLIHCLSHFSVHYFSLKNS
jgi:hypothetical protein